MAKADRKNLTKSIRFEVLKRDSQLVELQECCWRSNRRAQRAGVMTVYRDPIGEASP